MANWRSLEANLGSPSGTIHDVNCLTCTPLGNPETHARIRALTDCDELLQEFNRAMAVFDASSPGSERRAVALAYAETATERMKAVPDCK